MLAGGGVLSGCSGSGGSGGGGAPDGTGVAPKVTPGPKTAGVLYPPNYVGPIARDLQPITTEKVTFSIVVPQDLKVGDWKTNAFTKWLEQRTGIHIDFRQVATGDDMMTKVNAMIAAGDIPDAFLGVPWSRSQLYLFGQQGLFPDLSPHIDGYAVNLQQAMKDYPDSRKLMQSPDKKIYSFPSYNDCYHCRAGRGRAYLNNQWIEKVGLAAPKTTEEFRELLTAFKKADLGGNGRTIPFGGYKDSSLDTYFMNSFLYNPGEPWLFVKDDKVDATFAKDEWREGLKYLHGLYADGLINKDVFTADSDQMRRYGTTPGQPVLGGARVYSLGEFLDVASTDPNARYRQYTAAAPLEGPNGVRHAAWDHYAGVGVGTLVITKTCQRPELLVQWADYQMELQAILRSGYGPQGPNTWQWSKPGDLGLEGKQAVYRQNYDWANTTGQFWDQYGVLYRSRDYRSGERYNSKGNALEKGLLDDTQKYYEPYKQPIEMQYPPVALDQDQAAQEAELSTNLNGEVNLSFAKFVTGQLDPNDDAAWNDYKDRVEKIGLKPYLDVQQAGYEAYHG